MSGSEPGPHTVFGSQAFFNLEIPLLISSLLFIEENRSFALYGFLENGYSGGINMIATLIVRCDSGSGF
jgi:hypothetical protein